MAQLTLMDAVNGLQQGLDYGEKMRTRETAAAAGKAFTGALDAERTRWVEAQKAQGIEADPAAFKPDQGHYFNAAQAASQEYAKAGDWRGFMDQQVKLAPMRLQARASALQDYKINGDMPKLVQRFYETVPDGGTIAKAEMVDGTGPDGKTAAPMVRLHMGDGRVVLKPQAKLLESMTTAIEDPVKAAERDALLAKFAAEQALKTDGEIKVVRAKGDQERKTAGVQHGYKLEQIGLQNTGDMAVAQERSRATLGAAGISAGATRDAAHIRAEADLNKPVVYGPEQTVGLWVATPGGGRTLTTVATGGGKRMSIKELQDSATHLFGDQVNGVMGGSRIGGEKTASIAARANEIRNQNPRIPDDQALMMAAGEHGVKFPRRTPVPGLSLQSAQSAGGDGWSITREPDAQQPPGAAPAPGRPSNGGRVVDFSSLWK